MNLNDPPAPPVPVDGLPGATIRLHLQVVDARLEPEKDEHGHRVLRVGYLAPDRDAPHLVGRFEVELRVSQELLDSLGADPRRAHLHLLLEALQRELAHEVAEGLRLDGELLVDEHLQDDAAAAATDAALRASQAERS